MMCRGLAGTCSRLFMLLLLVACLNPGVCVTDTTCVADGDSCDDGNACTGPDTCQGGVCLGGSPLPCPGPPNTCTTMGECNPTTGCPSASPLANGTACALSSSTTGTCAGGVCVTTTCGPDGAACSPSSSTTGTPSGAACVNGSTVGTCAGGVCVTGISSPEVLVTFQTEAGDAAEALAIGEAACTDLRVANLTCVVAAKELTARRRLMGTWVVVITVSMNEALTYSAQDLAELGLDLSKGLSEAVTAYFTITKKLDVTSVVVMCGTGFVLVDLTCAAVVRVPAGSGFIQLYVITGLASPRLNV
ncbi:hypothetical protein FOA52_009874 [Chlamydomonas sp. UWO 241]|nr:hypothetical protein FOA52_009874 [Chlamydomonas sp. UWO 241]